MEEPSWTDHNEIFEMLRYDLDEALLALARSAELFQAEHGREGTRLMQVASRCGAMSFSPILPNA